MKKILTMGILALTMAAMTEQPADAWLNFKFGAGVNWNWQSGGNNTLWGLFRNGQPPGPAMDPGSCYPFPPCQVPPAFNMGPMPGCPMPGQPFGGFNSPGMQYNSQEFQYFGNRPGSLPNNADLGRLPNTGNPVAYQQSAYTPYQPNYYYPYQGMSYYYPVSGYPYGR